MQDQRPRCVANFLEIVKGFGIVSSVGSVGASASQRCPPDTRTPTSFAREGTAVDEKNKLLMVALLFGVSLDYLFGRTDDPHGAHYDYEPKLETINPEMEKFVEMCFDPNSRMNERLKETILKMLSESVGENEVVK